MLAVGDRLIPKTQRPTVFKESSGADAYSTSQASTDSTTGVLAPAYVRVRFFGAIISGSGLTTRVLADQLAFLDPVLNVLDYPSFQAAHDALPASGGTIVVPAGTYDSTTTTAFTGLVVTKSPFALIGEAAGSATALSRIVHDMTNAKDIDAIWLNIVGQALIKNLHIQGSDLELPGTGRGIRWYKAGATAQMRGLTIDNVTVFRSPNWSFEFICDPGAENWVSKLEMLQCTAYDAKSGGSLYLGGNGAGTNNNWFERCEFNGPGFGGYKSLGSCTLNGTTTVTATSLTGVAAGDEVNGLGFPLGTTVVSVNTSSTPNAMVLNHAASFSGTTVLAFYRATGPGTGQLPRGHVHLARTKIRHGGMYRFAHDSPFSKRPTSKPMIQPLNKSEHSIAGVPLGGGRLIEAELMFPENMGKIGEARVCSNYNRLFKWEVWRNVN